jgi:hypothetical protein
MMNEDMSVPVQVELHADNLQPLDPVRNGVGVAATVEVVILKCKNGLMSFSRMPFNRGTFRRMKFSRMILTFSRTILHRAVKKLNNTIWHYMCVKFDK